MRENHEIDVVSVCEAGHDGEMGSFFGQLFRIASFGESHGPGVGVVIEGLPPGLAIDISQIQDALDRRKPGQGNLTSSRQEPDIVEVLAGLENSGVSSGAPVCLYVKNKDIQSDAYKSVADAYRPGHAERSYELKYGLIPQSGGGRASARETLARVAAGEVARQMLCSFHPALDVQVIIQAVGLVETPEEFLMVPPRTRLTLDQLYCPDSKTAAAMRKAIEEARADGDSLGGVLQGRILNCPPGLGEPVFDKLEGDLAKAMMSIPAARGFELGEGFRLARLRGSEANDSWIKNEQGEISTATNRGGGILGGISYGAEIKFRVAFKPVSSIGRPQETVTRSGEAKKMELRGRHDPCVLPRAVPIVEAMTYLVLADHFLRQRAFCKI